MFSSSASQVSSDANYIEEVFSTWLYTGNGSTQTITNGIDLAGKGGLVWIKSRTNTSGGATSHAMVDSARGVSQWLAPDAVGNQSTDVNLVTGFNASGFSVGNAPFWANENSIPYSSWTFREQAKFFDVVTYTGDGTTSRNIPHSLGSTPGCIIVKATNATDDWYVYHRGCSTNNVLYLNLTNAQTSSTMFGTPTSTDFVVTTGGAALNVNGRQYVAYLFAHNAGGFGLTGTDNVISCGGGIQDGAVVNLGYEPQWVMFKRTDSSTGGNWFIVDTMRGQTAPGGNGVALFANTAGAEVSGENRCLPNATGFTFNAPNGAPATYIYIAIRRGPMKVPTTGASVFALAARQGASGVTQYIPSAGTSFPTDLLWSLGSNQENGSPVNPRYSVARLADTYSLELNTTAAEAFGPSNPIATISGQQNTVKIGAAGNINSNSTGTYIDYFLGRAPGFFDEVCYTGTGFATTVAHNLNVAPELMIVKSRSLSATNWRVYSDAIGAGNVLFLNLTDASAASSATWNSTAPTASVFSVGTSNNVNGSGSTYVAYLFATCPGVSKVGSYTGNGSNQTINCGFTGGARFVMIKRTDSTGDWYVWDSARGINAGNDPYLLLNNNAIEVTSTDYVDTAASGFELTATAPAAINANGGTFIFLAIS